MKKGILILIIIGIAITAALFLLPVTPPAEETAAEELAIDDHEGHNHNDIDAQVQAAIESLADTTQPPMQAILKLRSIADEHPEHYQANLTLGLLSMRTAQYENAVMRFEKASEAAPDKAEIYGFLAQAHQAMGNTAAARASLEKGLAKAEGDQVKVFEDALIELSTN